MKILLTITRILVGVLFIFSGLVKANDPLGLSYKMNEYFEVWHQYWLYDYSLALALVMNIFEIIAGIAVLLGWRMRLFGWLLLLLIIFFTYLTAYAAFSGKIAACGCFGDCIPLTPIQSFWKDVILLVMIVFLLINHKSIRAIASGRVSLVILGVSTVLIAAMQWYVLVHLPFIDCLPYKKGNDLVKQMQQPAGYIPDEYRYEFIYRKDGKLVRFSEDELPDDLDESYVFVERKEELVRKGNGLLPKITDFNLVTASGNDTTYAILQQPSRYILVMMNQYDAADESRYDTAFWQKLNQSIPVYLVTSVPVDVKALPVFKADGTVIKTAARANPTYFLMEGPVVKGKYSYARTEELQKALTEK